MKKKKGSILLSIIIVLFMLSACSSGRVTMPDQIGRDTAIPADAEKMSAAIDENPQSCGYCSHLNSGGGKGDQSSGISMQ